MGMTIIHVTGEVNSPLSHLYDEMPLALSCRYFSDFESRIKTKNCATATKNPESKDVLYKGEGEIGECPKSP